MALLLVLLASMVCSAATKPNIILFLTDDLGYGSVNHNATWGFPVNALDPLSNPVGGRAGGLETIATPNLARMASQGIRATMSYSASSICAPSRAAIFLERHVGIIDCIRGNAYEATHELPNTTAEGFVKTMQRDAGYIAGYFGKWGLGEVRGGPWSVGFDEFAGVLTHREAHVAFPNTVYEFMATRNAIPTSREHVDLLRVTLGVNSLHKWTDSNTTNATYFNDYIVDRALQFIQQPREEPFLVVISPTYPHWAIYNTEDTHTRHFAVTKLITPSRVAQKPVIMRNYASQIEQHLDRDVGRILNLLQRDAKLDANTLFVFTSDNGGDKLSPLDKTIYKPNGGLLGGKFDMYEGGLRVPTILRWPGVFAAGTVSRTPFVLFDLFPTFREIAGVPPAPTHDVNGRPTLALSMLQVWRTGSEDTVKSRKVLHFEYCNNVTKRTSPCTMATMDLTGYYSQPNPTVYKMVQLKTLKKTRKVYDLKLSPSEKRPVTIKAMRQVKQQALTAERSVLRTEFNPQDCAL